VIDIAASRTVVFRAARRLKECVNGQAGDE